MSTLGSGLIDGQGAPHFFIGLSGCALLQPALLGVDRQDLVQQLLWCNLVLRCWWPCGASRAVGMCLAAGDILAAGQVSPADAGCDVGIAFTGAIPWTASMSGMAFAMLWRR